MVNAISLFFLLFAYVEMTAKEIRHEKKHNAKLKFIRLSRHCRNVRLASFKWWNCEQTLQKNATNFEFQCHRYLRFVAIKIGNPKKRAVVFYHNVQNFVLNNWELLI